MRFIHYLLFIAILFSSCSNHSSEKALEELQAELRNSEQAFSDSTLKKGFMRAFLDFAAEDAVLFNDGHTLLSTVSDVRARVANIPVGGKPPYEMTWIPERIDVSGSLAYTYGRFKITSNDTSGNEIVKRGLYSSVWKRQSDGSWKVVLD